MRPLSGRSRGSFLLPILLLASTTLAVPAPSPYQAGSSAELDDRGYKDVLADIGAAAGNITQEIGSIVQDVSSIVQTFVGIVQEIKNASTENDLVGLLGMNVQGAPDDTNKTANGSVSAVGTNITCPGMAVLFARGTTEPGMSLLLSGDTYTKLTIMGSAGNVGIFTGPSFITALRNYINGTTSLAVQGVDYPASIPGFLAGGSPSGSFVMAAIVNKTAAACPSTKIVLAGYSQGAQLVHNAMTLINPASSTTTNSTTTTTTAAAAGSTATTTTNTTAAAAKKDDDDKDDDKDDKDNDLVTKRKFSANSFASSSNLRFNSAAVTSSVSSVILFGDPRNGTAVSGIDQARVLSFCNSDDDICAKGGDIITLDHLTYNRDAPAAAMFVMQKTALGVASNDATNQGMGNVPSVPAMSGMNGATKVSGTAGLPRRWLFADEVASELF